jgi:hypothetical protein
MRFENYPNLDIQILEPLKELLQYHTSPIISSYDSTIVIEVLQVLEVLPTSS